MNLKKAAMFGLDARIALIVFGTLSLVAGSSIFSAIQNAKVATIIVQNDNIKKAWQSYFADTKRYLPRNDGSSSASSQYRILKTKELVENNSNVKNWNGPYLEMKPSHSGTQSIRCPGTDGMHCTIEIMEIKDGTNTDNCRFASDKCSLWIEYSTFFSPADKKDLNLSLMNLLDREIDGADGASNGDFQWRESVYTYRFRMMNIEPLTF